MRDYTIIGRMLLLFWLVGINLGVVAYCSGWLFWPMGTIRTYFKD